MGAQKIKTLPPNPHSFETLFSSIHSPQVKFKHSLFQIISSTSFLTFLNYFKDFTKSIYFLFFNSSLNARLHRSDFEAVYGLSQTFLFEDLDRRFRQLFVFDRNQEAKWVSPLVHGSRELGIKKNIRRRCIPGEGFIYFGIDRVRDIERCSFILSSNCMIRASRTAIFQNLLTSMDTSNPSSSSHQWKYHVFLSFRGEDTRKSFTDHLHTALKQEGVITFRDKENVKRGKPISLELLKAIEESLFAIVILSRNYASSTWSFDELVKIMECRKKIGLIVLPIFYDVDPSEVRKLMGSYAEAFIEHEKNFKKNIDKVHTWKAT
ncbi:uncharacterized protein LOC126720557 isoform X2 [Quercus robur]|uniref:uncharacterized protein LOC126720557 isoform X2 n=1 Tax=Quercus robur TaxID=38942 RepID=UPI002163E1E8|nr:uncharacterized protein LOC126720557 isoform X2 [Quercus robur]